MSEIAILGIGNNDRGDDAIGLALSEKIAKENDARFSCYQSDGNITKMLSVFEKHDQVLLIDACLSITKPVGDTMFINLQEKNLPREKLQSSSHVIDISQTIELARSLKLLPKKLYLFAVYCNQFEIGKPMSKILCDKFDTIFNQLKEAILCMSNH